MPYIHPDLVEKAKRVNLLEYLQERDPDELIPIAGGYKLRSHDSLKISNDKWMWWSRGIGGRSAVDYLIKVEEMSFLDAVGDVLGDGTSDFLKRTSKQVEISPRKRFVSLPRKSSDCSQVFEYLLNRGLSGSVLEYCIEQKILYESLPHHNVVFVGRDSDGVARYAFFRAANESRIMGDCRGSDKRFSFRIVNPKSDTVHVFESAIDALSYASLMELDGRDPWQLSYLSLAGIAVSGQSVEISHLPIALQSYLDSYPQTKRIALHLDNDGPGREATEDLIRKLKDRYTVIDAPAPFGKDINDFLIHTIQNAKG